MRLSKAFTLIEILVALLVLSIAMSMFSNATNGSLRSLERIETGRVAGWMASNELASARLERRVKDTPIETGRRQRLVQMAGREWEVTRNVRPTSHPWLRRIEVRVRLSEAESFDDYAISLTGYVGRY